MTSTNSSGSSTPAAMPPVQSVPVTLLDSQGRVRASKEQRRIILAEFERSGVSAARFAKRTGLNYSTFAGWLQRYRRPKPRGPHPKPVRLLEAVMEPTPASGGQSPQALVVALPGGARLEIGDVNKCPWPRRCYGRYTSHAEFFRELESVRGGGSVRYAQRLQWSLRRSDGASG